MPVYECYKDTGFPDIGMVPVEWNIGVIKNGFDIVCGATPSEYEGNWNGDIPWVGPADMPMFGTIGHGKRNLSETGYNSCGTTLVPKGSIVLSTRAPIGKICLAGNDLCTNQGCKCLVPKEGFHTGFYSYYLFSILERLQQDGTGTTFKELSTSSLKQEPMVLLDVAAQAAISEYLDVKVEKIDSLIDEAKASIEEYKAWKASIIYEAVTKGLDKDVEMKDSYNQLIGIIPAHWKVSTLSALSDDIQNGYVGPTRDLFVDTGVKYIQSLHIKEGNILFDRHPYYVRNEWAEKHPKIHKGDVLIVQTGDIGQVGLVNEEYDNCNCHALIIVSLNKQYVYPEFIKYYFMNPNGKEILLSYQTGALLPHLNAGRIKAASICYPSINEQKRIVQYLDEKSNSIDALISEKESLISDLEEYKKSLIFEVVTGKRKVV